MAQSPNPISHVESGVVFCSCWESDFEIIQRTRYPLTALLEDVGINHRGGDIPVSEELLDCTDVDASLKKVSREGMTKGVGADLLGQTGTAPSALTALLITLVRKASIRDSAGKRFSRERMRWKRTNRTIHSI